MSALYFSRKGLDSVVKSPTLVGGGYFSSFGKSSSSKASSLSKTSSISIGIPLAALALIVLSLLLGTITCLLRPGTTYERFDAQLTTQVTQEDLTTKLKTVTGLLQKDEALLDEAANVTCGVYRQISSSLIKNESAPSDSLQPIPQEEQTALTARGQAKFEQTKCSYITKNGNQPLLDCFANQEASKAEQDLKAAVLALDAQLNASKMKMKARGVQTTLGFTKPYVNEIVKAFSEGFYGCEGSEGSADSVASVVKSLAGSDLTKKGVELYNDAMKIHQDIQSLPQVAKMQKEMLAAVKARTDKLNNPSPEETAHFKEEGKDPKYTS